MRALCGDEVYIPLLVEAMARLLECKIVAAKEKPFPVSKKVNVLELNARQRRERKINAHY
jgi:hypothetical protein